MIFNVVISFINELRKVPLQRLYLPQSTVSVTILRKCLFCLIVSQKKMNQVLNLTFVFQDSMLTLKGPGIFTVFLVGADLKLQIGM